MEKIKETVKGSVVARSQGGEGDEHAEHRGFSGTETILNDTIQGDTWHYILFKTHRMYNIKSDP